MTWSEISPILAGLDHLEDLVLDDNDIAFKDEFLDQIPEHTRLDLSGNRLDCSECKILSFVGLKMDKCVDGNSTHALNGDKEEVQRVRNRFCNSDHFKLYITVAALSTLATVLALIIIATCISERVRIRLYHHRFFGKFFLPETDLEGKDFDVFISYSEEDDDLAISMAEKLEGKIVAGSGSKCRKFSCCLHQRDWTAGKEISQNIVESVDKSRRTVIILSRSFLRSKFCLQEFSQAYARNRLLVVMRVDTDSKEADVTNDDLVDVKFDAIRNYIQVFSSILISKNRNLFQISHQTKRRLAQNVFEITQQIVKILR